MLDEIKRNPDGTITIHANDLAWHFAREIDRVNAQARGRDPHVAMDTAQEAALLERFPHALRLNGRGAPSLTKSPSTAPTDERFPHANRLA